jgi:hypothetical protein
VPYVKNFKPAFAANSQILTIKEHTSFGQVLTKIKKIKNTDFVVIEKPKIGQMAAVLLLKIAGKKFIWLQNFSNPPIPNVFAKLLLSQADSIVVRDKKNYYRLRSYGIKSTKIRYKKN